MDARKICLRLIPTAALAIALAGCGSNEPAVQAEEPQPEAQQMEVVNCLTDLGYDVTALDDGGVEVQLSSSQPAEQYQSDFADCQATVGLETEVAPLTTEQLQDVYAQTRSTAECLEGEGYEMPDLPSEQYFVDNYYPDPYVPFAFLPQDSITQEEIDRLMIECPQPRL